METIWGIDQKFGWCVDGAAYIYYKKMAQPSRFCHPQATSDKQIKNSYFRHLKKFLGCALMVSTSQPPGRRGERKIMKNTITLTHDELANIVANAVAQALTQTQAHVSTPAPVQAPTQARTQEIAPEQAPTQARTYEHVNAGFDNFVVKADKRFVDAFVRNEYTLVGANGKKSLIKADTRLAYAYGHKDAWDAFKARMRNAGAAYNTQAKAWEFPTPKAAKTFVEGVGSTPITVDELNAVRDRWTAKAEKRANKAE